MSTVLQPIERPQTGEPTQDEIEHDNIAKCHFLRYCDTKMCIRGRRGVKSWHEGVCVECAFNPYNMQAGEGVQDG